MHACLFMLLTELRTLWFAKERRTSQSCRLFGLYSKYRQSNCMTTNFYKYNVRRVPMHSTPTSTQIYKHKYVSRRFCRNTFFTCTSILIWKVTQNSWIHKTKGYFHLCFRIRGSFTCQTTLINIKSISKLAQNILLLDFWVFFYLRDKTKPFKARTTLNITRTCDASATFSVSKCIVLFPCFSLLISAKNFENKLSDCNDK